MSSSEINNDWAAYLRDRMEAQKLNQSELSKLTKVRQDKISRYLNCKNKITLAEFELLISVLSPDLSRILSEKRGRPIILCYPLAKEIYSNIHLNLIQSPSRDKSHSHIHRPIFTIPPDRSWVDSTPACKNDERKPIIHQSSGDRPETTLEKYFNKALSDIQLQCKLGLYGDGPRLQNGFREAPGYFC